MRQPLPLLLLAALAAAITLPLAPLAARPESSPHEDAPPAVRAALLDGDWDGALRALDEATRVAPAEADLHLLLRGQIAAARRDPAAAEVAFHAVETRFPQSPWLVKARFGRAEALRDLRRFAEAEALVAAEVARLRADGRRSELLALAVELADRALDPGPIGAPDTPAAEPARALALYDQLLPLEPPAALAARIQRQRGHALLRLDQPEAAQDAFAAYLSSAAAATLSTESIDARLALADCQSRLDLGSDARRTLDRLADELAKAPDAATRARLGDALLAAARTRNDDPERLLRVAALRHYLALAPDHPQRYAVRLEIAQLLGDAGRSDEALAALADLLALPPSDESVVRAQAEAAFRRGRLLLAQGQCEAAQAAFAEAIARDPAGPRWAEAQAAMVEAEYRAVTLAEEKGDQPAARRALEQWIARHPLDGRVDSSRVHLGDLWLAEAEAGRKAGAPTATTAALDRAAIDEWERVVRARPGSAAASIALFNAGTRWQALGELERAVETWRRCNFGSHASAAAAALAVLVTPSLSVVTPRSFRSGEAAVLELRTRNLPEVTVKLHRLDLDAYFRKFLAADGVERLDLDLIAPDQSFQFAIPDYARWKEFVGALPLPLAGSGTWIAVVEAGESRATTLVQKGDLDLIVKASRHELLVYAEERVGGTPASGVLVLCDIGVDADGIRRQLTGTTGDDGVLHLRSEPLFDPSALHVLARRGDDMAVVNLPLDGVAAPPPEEARGLLFTDRPAYRPGDTLTACAFLREPQARRLVVPGAKQWTLTLADPRGRVVTTTPLDLDAFGTAAIRLTLDALAPTGDWVVTVTREDGPRFRSTFVVADYELDRVKLDLALPRPVWFRGEQVPLAATAIWQHGAPVVDAIIRFTFPDGRDVDVTTDANGRAATTFDTADLQDEERLLFRATLLDGGIVATATGLLATREFDLMLELPSRALLAGERFAVGVTATGRDGTPRATAVKLTLARRVDGGGDGSGGETTSEQRTVTTAAQDGRAALETALTVGGRYVVRAEAVDRFGQPIAAEGMVWITADDDAQKLRLLADRTALEAGESTRVRLVQRGGGGRVLLTWEQADALRWRVLDARDEITELAIAADDGLVPGFVLAAAAIRATALRRDAVGFAVTRALVLRVKPRAGSVAPGEEVTIDVETRDPLGQPVAAQVALAVVDDALLRQFVDGTARPDRVFAPIGGVPSPWPTATSCAFRYAGAARAIDREVLSEGRRWEAERQLTVTEAGLLQSLGYLSEQSDGAAAAFRKLDDAAQDLEKQQAEPGAPTGGGGSGGMVGIRLKATTGLAKRGLGAADASGFAGVSGETAWFAPAVTTGADGTASVTFRMPDRATTWQLVARGITVDTRAAQASATLIARDSFLADLRVPARFVQGDSPRLLATLFRDESLAGVAKLRLRATLGEQVVSLPADVDLAAATSAEHLFPALPPLPLVEAITLELTATMITRDGPRETRFIARVPVVPWGIERLAARSGELKSRTAFTLELPAGESYVTRRLELLLAPSAPRLLLDEALERTRAPKLAANLLAQDSVATDLLGSCELLALGRQLLEAAQASALDLSELRARAAAQLSRLVVAQQDDGGWPWAGANGSDRATSALALLALERAEAVGFTVPAQTRGNALDYVEKAFRAAGPQADELKALLQLALSRHGRGDAAALQRLHRVRSTLSTAGLAYACLALAAAERGPMAAELAALLEQRALPLTAPESVGCRWDASGNGRFNRSSLETAAWAVMALSATRFASPVLAQGVAALMAARPWAPERAAGLARAALGRFYAASAPERSEATVRVRVAERELPAVKLAPGSGVVTVDVPGELVREGAVRVELELAGRATPSYVALLRGYTTQVARRDQAELRVAPLALLAPAPIVRGRPLTTGFTALTETPRDAWRNRLTELPQGELCEVEFQAALGPGGADVDDSDPYALTLPLPAGAELLPGSVRGDFVACAARPGALDFRLLRTHGWVTIQLTLIGRLPGDWRVLPPELRSAVDLDRAATGDPWTLRVLPRGAKSADAWRATPDELLDLGRRRHAAGDARDAAEPLEQLVAQFGGRLRDPIQREVARILLTAALESGDAARIVRQFEIVKEKDPELALPGEAVRQVAAAYRSLEEPEPALELWQALLDETFTRDLKLASLLKDARKPRAAFALRERLWLEHPDTAASKQSWLALSDELLSLAPRAHDDPLLRAEGLDGATLRHDGMRVLTRFLTHSPADPLAPEAGLGLVAAWLTVGNWEQAATLADRLARRFPEPRFSDSFLYSKAVAEWSLGHDDVAKELLERIAAAEYVEPGGRKVPSQNRELAWYILAQIHHARREAEASMRYYEKVAASWPDAREALSGLRERRLELPEVTTARPGGKAALAITAKNLARADLLVYSVDLMTLCLRQRNLSGVAGVELAGIAPVAQLSVDLLHDAVFEPRTTTVALDLPQEGAYLVLARADEHHASGLLLVTPIDLQVKEEAEGGRVRVHVQQAADGRFLRDVDVRVIGSGDAAFVAGRTDARGLFSADGVDGAATIIARAGDRAYAFWRGTRPLIGDATRDKKPGQTGGSKDEGDLGNDAYLKNVLELNRGLQQQRAQQMDQEIQNAGKGIKVNSRGQ